jgi:hypothetical protein
MPRRRRAVESAAIATGGFTGMVMSMHECGLTRPRGHSAFFFAKLRDCFIKG